MNNEYYVYAKYKECPIANPLAMPFYIGKGYGKRDISMSGRNSHFINIINKHGHHTKRLAEFLSEEDAFAYEMYYISYYGRADKNEGPLVNHTDGGEGQSGLKHSEKTRQYLSDLARKQFSNPLAVQIVKDAARRWRDENPNLEQDRIKRGTGTRRLPHNRQKAHEKRYEALKKFPDLSKRQTAGRKAYWASHPDEYAEFEKRRIAASVSYAKSDEGRERNRQRYVDDPSLKIKVTKPLKAFRDDPKNAEKVRQMNIYAARSKAPKNKYGVCGVDKLGLKFRARIMVNYKQIWLGTFDTLEQAIAARKAAQEKYFK